MLDEENASLGDRFNRRYAEIIQTQTAAMILAFILAVPGLLSGRVQVWHLFVLAALVGVVNAIDIPVRQAILLDMGKPEDLLLGHLELVDGEWRAHCRTHAGWNTCRFDR